MDLFTPSRKSEMLAFSIEYTLFVASKGIATPEYRGAIMFQFAVERMIGVTDATTHSARCAHAIALNSSAQFAALDCANLWPEQLEFRMQFAQIMWDVQELIPHWQNTRPRPEWACCPACDQILTRCVCSTVGR